jgi:uncharacterized protein
VDRSVLAARIQEILKGRSRPASSPPASEYADTERPGRVAEGAQAPTADEDVAFAARCAADEAASDSCDVLDGESVEGPGGRCLVVERRYPATHAHGAHPFDRYASAARTAIHSISWFPGAEEAQADLSRLLFFDLETTGLSGGAGTCAFLVGCGYFEAEDFVTRQYFLRGFGEERAMLDAVRGFVEGRCAGGALPCLVTYNGRGFDLPLIDMRYVFHRRPSPFATLPHVDMLYAARRLWRRRPTVVGRLDRASSPGDGVRYGAADDQRASCALTALEQDILGLERHDDVPGWEIPARYFAYTRTGDARGLAAVLEHNRLDLLSLAAVAAVILEMVVQQDGVPREPHDCVALARLLEHLGREADAERCYERAAAVSSWGPASAGPVAASTGRREGLVEGEFDRLARAEALHWLALHRRRGRRFADAAEAWQALLGIPGLDPALRREACEALAIHHEHRARDLAAAQAFALKALDVARGGRHVGEVEHRLDRLSRKLGARPKTGGTPAQPGLRMEE